MPSPIKKFESIGEHGTYSYVEVDGWTNVEVGTLSKVDAITTQRQMLFVRSQFKDFDLSLSLECSIEKET
jgi:hypothetical protein